MDDFLLELRALDETQDRVEAVSDEMLRAHTEGDTARVNAMVTHWIDALRASDLHSERVAFLYVANHVLQKSLFGDADAVDSSGSTTPDFVGLFGAHMEEAVSLVSNSPMDRQNVTRLLELWHEKDVYPDEVILGMWRCTGEDLPSFLQSVAANGTTNGNGSNANHGLSEDADHELRHTHLPMKLNAHSANPVLDVLKRIDYHKVVLQYLDRMIQEKHQFVLLHATSTYQSPEDVLADRGTTAAQLKRRVEDCLRLVKIRNKYMTEIPALKKQLVQAVAKLKQDEVDFSAFGLALSNQCDIIDIGLADLSEHRDTYPEEWSREAYECTLRRRRKEEELRQREEQMVRLHQEAIAESAAHAMHLEADINAGSSADLQTLSKELESQKAAADKEPKLEEANEMVWHPACRRDWEVLLPQLRRNRENLEHERDDTCAEDAGGWECGGPRHVVERDAAEEHGRQRQLHRSVCGFVQRSVSVCEEVQRA